MFKIEALSKDEYREVQVPFDLEASSRRKGENSWNGLRHHHLDSGNTNQHYRKRSECLRRFSELYGSLSDRRWEFGERKDGWDL